MCSFPHTSLDAGLRSFFIRCDLTIQMFLFTPYYPQTLGGSLVAQNASSDVIVALLAVGASVTVASSKGWCNQKQSSLSVQL